MRILIITHERTGGHALLHWLAKEVGSLRVMHEPLDTQGETETKELLQLLHHPHLIAKERINPLVHSELLETLPATCTHVICLTREDTREAAISRAHLELSGAEAHAPYRHTQEWEGWHQETILKHSEAIQADKELILALPYLQVTYENIYVRPPYPDRDKIKALLWIDNFQYEEEFLNPRRRLRKEYKSKLL